MFLMLCIILVGGFKHFFFSIIYGLSSFPLTNIFQDGYCTTPPENIGEYTISTHLDH